MTPVTIAELQTEKNHFGNKPKWFNGIKLAKSKAAPLL
jgi:hypothetical protein